MTRCRFRLIACHGLVLGLLSLPAFASRPYLVNDEVGAQLQKGAAAGEKLVIRQMPLFDGNPATITLQRFEVWAPNVDIVEYGDGGKVTHLPRPTTAFYRGQIEGDPGSTVFVSVEADGEIRGMAFAGDGLRKLSIGRGRRAGQSVRGEPGMRDREAPLLTREFDEVDDVNTIPTGGFHCDVEKTHMETIGQAIGQVKARTEANSAPSVSTAYGLNLAIETDYELYQAFGSSSALTSYLGSLIGEASVIYQRDLSTTLTIGTTHIWSTSSDPWTVTPPSTTDQALVEFGTYWHNNYSSVNRSSVVMVSGKAFYGGIAWENQLCKADFFCGVDGSFCGGATFDNAWAGGYAFCGSTVVTTTVPDPTLTINTVQYALPLDNNFWMLLEVCHELGHNANGPHTHCVSTANTPYSGLRPYVDICYNAESGCYAGATTDYPSELGTVMSYCHNLSTVLNQPPGAVAGYPASRYLFGQAGEASSLVLPYFTTGLEAGTPNGAITVGTNLPCTAGQTASVASGAASYAWQITGGNITAGGSTSTVTFTPAGSSVTLNVTVANTAGCSLTSQIATTSQCSPLAAPTNVTALAGSTTSVTINWTASSGATSYEVDRSSDHIHYTPLTTNTGNTTTYTDINAAAGVSYLYTVRAVSPGTSPFSAPDLATTLMFTDPTLTSSSTIVKLVHFTDLRTAIDSVRTLAGLGAYAYTTPTLTAGSPILAVDLTDMRTALDQARAVLSLPAVVYTDPTITPASTTIKAAHITDLRNGIQ